MATLRKSVRELALCRNFTSFESFSSIKLENLVESPANFAHQVTEDGYHSGQYVNNHSEAENKQFTAAFSQITEGFKVSMEQGLSADHESVQELVRQHYEFRLQFWRPDRESYKSLAMSYILPSPYQESYEAVAKGLGQYHYDAIVIFADQNL